MLRAAPKSRRRTGTLLALLALVVVIIAANIVSSEIAAGLRFDIRPSNEDAFHRTLMAVAALYVLAMAIPFVPAVEIGLALIAVFGPPAAVVLYACTVAALCASFLIGRLIPLSILGRLFEEVSLRRASDLMRRLEPLDQDARLSLLLSDSPGRVVPWLLRHRYITLAVALNIPGNVLIGGGGGIAMTAGIARLYSIPGFLLTVALAVAPVPLAVVIVGKEILSR